MKYQYFLLSFSAAFLVLSLMLLFMMNMLRPKIPESLLNEPDDASAAEVYAPTAQDCLTVLFIGSQKEDSKSAVFLLARFDPFSGKVPLIAFPPETAVENAGKTEPLLEVYLYGGAEYTKNALSEALEIPIDRYVKMRLDSFVMAASVIGTVEYELKDTITVTRDGTSVTLKQGKQLLDGQKAADIIGYDYPEGGLYRSEIISGLAAAVVNQRKDIFLTTVSDNVFEKIINIIATDISYPDYYNRKNAARFMAQMSPSPAEPVEATGKWSGDGKLFILSDTFLASLTQIMM